MPTYEYRCEKCGITFEMFQSMRDAPLKVCTCGKKGKVKRLIGRGAGIIFKGSGFYETDYRRKPAKSGGSKAEGEGGSKSGATPSVPAKDSPAPPSGTTGAAEKK